VRLGVAERLRLRQQVRRDRRTRPRSGPENTRPGLAGPLH